MNKRNDDDFIGVYHPFPTEAPEHWKLARKADEAMRRAQDPWFKNYWMKIRDYLNRKLN